MAMKENQLEQIWDYIVAHDGEDFSSKHRRHLA